MARSITIHSEPLHATSHDGILYQLDQTLLLPRFSNLFVLERMRGSGTETTLSHTQLELSVTCSEMPTVNQLNSLAG